MQQQAAVVPSSKPSDSAPSPPVETALSGRNINELVRPRWSHLEYRWKLDNFWELRALACVEALEDENGGLIWSQRFGDKDRGYWQLKLYPYGDLSPAGRGHVSLFLSLDLKSLDVPKAYAIFGCYLLDEEGQKVANSGRSFTRQKFAEGSSSWGWSQFIKVEGQTLNRLLSGQSDALIIKCEIEVFVGVAASPGRSLPKPRTWEEELHEYLSNPANFDVSCLCEGRIFKGNRHVMMARSEWFATQLAPGAPPKLSASGSLFCLKNGGTAPPTEADVFVTRDSTSTHQQHSLTYASFGGIESLNSTAATLPDSNATAAFPPLASSPATQVPLPPSKDYHLEITECSAEVFENLLSYIHDDDCRYFAQDAGITNLLALFIASKKFEVSSLYATLTRRLCQSIVSKPTALAVQEVAREVGAKELTEHCHSYLLMCVRQLSDDELLKTLVPKPR